ncbi:MAG: hypothetical protein R3C56_06400 [Pirellulaceae bacterium]
MIVASGPMLSPQAGYTMLAIFGILWVSLGLWWGRRAKSYDGFAVAGRNVGLALGTATAVATWITSITTMLYAAVRTAIGYLGGVGLRDGQLRFVRICSDERSHSTTHAVRLYGGRVPPFSAMACWRQVPFS